MTHGFLLLSALSELSEFSYDVSIRISKLSDAAFLLTVGSFLLTVELF